MWASAGHSLELVGQPPEGMSLLKAGATEKLVIRSSLSGGASTVMGPMTILTGNPKQPCL